MDKSISKLIELAKMHPMSAEAKEEQRRSFVLGNIGFEKKNEGKPITREMVDECADRLASHG